jgi:SAM-dependent methyltransferase
MKNPYQYKHWEIFNPVEQARLLRVLGGLVTGGLRGGKPKALDYGAGTGNVTHKLLSLGCHVTACDISRDSLRLLKHASAPGAPLETLQVDGSGEGLPADHFDIITIYSVLHHVPDYLLLIQRLLRSLKPGGVIFIDHEFNEAHWLPSPQLNAYYDLTRRSFMDYLKAVWGTGELATFDYYRGVLIKMFMNRRFEREGDLHVWPDDHIEWDAIMALLRSSGCVISQNVDYLLYNPKGGERIYEVFSGQCADMKYLVATKQ